MNHNLTELNEMIAKQQEEIELLKNRIFNLEYHLMEITINQEQDIDELTTLTKWIDDYCVLNPNAKVEARDFYKSWLNHSGLNGNRKFYEKIKNLGFEVRKSSKNKLYVFGLTLKSGD